MNKILSVFMAAVLGIAVFSSTGFASGYRLPEQDSTALGMASAFVGQADNPAAVWYNPAGMTQLDGTRISGGTIGIYPVLAHENTDGTTDVSERGLHLPIHLYGTHRLNDSIAFGVGVNNPFGLATDWDSTSSTRYIATFSKVLTTEVNPNIAYKLNDTMSVAFGVAYVHLRATLEKTVSVVHPVFGPLGDHNFRLSGDGDGWGLNAAALYKAAPNVNVGLSYRSRIKIDVDGDVGLTGGPAATTATGQTSITLPDLIQLGVSYKASDKLTVNADIDYTMWSTYDRIVVTSNNPLFDNSADPDEKQWRDVWCIRLGGQYQLSDQWKLRAGYVYDKNPVGEAHFETRTPDSDRQGISIGTGYAIGNMTVDLAYMYLRFNSRTINDSAADNAETPVDDPATPTDSLNGTYKSSAQLAGITIGYKF